jgi:hypothetical protein
MTQSPPGTPQADPGRGAAQECAAIAADLERLKSIIADAGDKLLVSFNRVGALAPEVLGNDRSQEMIRAINVAVTALQFQDMATQLTGHAQRRLGALQECLKSLSSEAALGLSDDQAQPVHQAEMSPGAVDLF